MIVYNINAIVSKALIQSETKIIQNYADDANKELQTSFEQMASRLDTAANGVGLCYDDHQWKSKTESIVRELRNELQYGSVFLLLDDKTAQESKNFLLMEITEQGVISEKRISQQEVEQNREKFQLAEENGLYINNTIETDIDGEKQFFAGKSIELDTQKIGMIGYYSSLNDIIYRDAQPTSDGHTNLLLSESGTILYCTDSKFVGKNISQFYPDIDLSQKEGQAVENVSLLTKKKALIFTMPITLYKDKLPSFILVDMPLSDAERISIELQNSIFAMSTMGLIICVVVIFFGTRNIIRPLRQITATADAISEGNLEVGFGDEYNDIKNSKNEVIILSKALAKMLDQLTRYQQVKVEAIAMLHEKNTAVEASNAKSNFLANMSHEIRTPMNAIIGMAEMILRCDINEQVKEHTTYIKSAGKSLLTIINDILDFSKIEAGKLEIIPVEYQLTSMLNDIANLSKVRIGDKKVKMIIDAERNLPFLLYGDEIRIKQLITNYVNNAIKFTSTGSVTLQIKGLEKGGQFHLDIKVIDTGIGIKEEDLTKLFSSFSQVDTKKNRTVEGTGLGLAICKTLTELMGGTVSVESEYGVGSTFSSLIPQTVVDATPIGEMWEINCIPDSEVFHAAFIAPEANILIVDDNEVNLVVAKGLISPYQMNVTTASSAAECLTLLKAYQYDIIFMDHMMPVMDGVEAVNIIRKTDAVTPIVALTANAISGVREMYLANGFNDYLSKPIEIVGLDKILKTYLPKSYQKAVAGEDIVVDTALSEQVKHSIYTEGQRKIPLLKELFQQKDWKRYSIETHALKSVAKVANHTELSELARTHEQEAKDGHIEQIECTFELLITLYEKLLDCFKPQEQSECVDKVSISEQEIKNLFKRVGECAAEFDIDGMAASIEQLKNSQLDEHHKKLLDGIVEAAQSLDYDDVLRQCESI